MCKLQSKHLYIQVTINESHSIPKCTIYYISNTQMTFASKPITDLSTHQVSGYTVEPPIMDSPKSGQPPYNGHTVHYLPMYCPYIPTSEEGTTSEQWTKCLSPTCPLFGGSTVYKCTQSAKQIIWSAMLQRNPTPYIARAQDLEADRVRARCSSRVD